MRKNDAAIHLWNADATLFDLQKSILNVTRIVTPKVEESNDWADTVVSKSISDAVSANSVYKGIFLP